MRINGKGNHNIQPMGDGDSGKKNVHMRASKIGLGALAAGKRTEATASKSMTAGGHTASTTPHGPKMNFFKRSA